MPIALNCLKTTDLDLGAAVFLAHASDQAYSADPGRWATRQGFSEVTPFNLGNVQGYWGAGDKVALLVFRGTSNLGQWIRNGRIFPVRHSWGNVHMGFGTGLGMLDDILQVFDGIATRSEYVWVTGHSLGGALAVLAAARLKINGIQSQTYTYGQPRMGLSNFASRFNAELPGRPIRFINQNDIVPRLPSGLLYRHMGVVKRIVRPGVLEAGLGIFDQPIVELDDCELPQASDAEAEIFLNEIEANPGVMSEGGGQTEGRMGSFFKDHSIGEYIRLLTEIKPTPDRRA